MSAATLKARLVKLETVSPEIQFSIEDLGAMIGRLGFVDLDSPTGSPALLAIKAELKAFLAKLTKTSI